MTKKATLIDAIYAVETNKETRLSGLIIEHYLLRKLKASLAERNYSEAQTGWIIQKLGFCSLNEKYAEDEHWYRVISPDTPLSAVDHVIVNTFSRPGRRFFSVAYTIKPIILSSRAIKLSVKEICASGKILPSNLTTPNLQKSVDEYLNKKTLNKKSGLLAQWFHHFEQNELVSVFIQRCIMNSMDNCVDIDAAALHTNSKELTFFEFKRKYQVKGARKFTKNFFNTFPNISNIVYDVTPKMNTCKNNLKANITLTNDDRTHQLRQEFDNLLPNGCFSEYTTEPSARYFGLDWSHYQILNMCNKAKVTYKYLIWNLNPASITKETKKSPTYENTILKYLLTPTLSKNKKSSFLQESLTCADAIGLTFTEGSDSGALSKDVRLQVLFSFD